MRNTIAIRLGLGLWVLCTPALGQATSMKSTAPERMLPRSDAAKMRACDEQAMREKVPMEQKAAFVKKCMAEMK